PRAPSGYPAWQRGRPCSPHTGYLGGCVPTTDSSIFVAAVLACYILVLWIPGGLAAAAAGLRGWALAAVAPLITYAIGGLFGPWTSLLGISWNPLVFAACSVLVIA